LSAAWIWSVQRLTVFIQRCFERLNAPRQGLAFYAKPGRRRHGSIGNRFKLSAEGQQGGPAVGHSIVEQEEPILQPFRSEPLPHNLQRRLLLANDQDAFASPDAVADDVYDRLALAGARRPLDDQAWMAPRPEHGGFLRRVSLHREIAVHLRDA
jgi:hypothetical protein